MLAKNAWTDLHGMSHLEEIGISYQMRINAKCLRHSQGCTDFLVSQMALSGRAGKDLGRLGLTSCTRKDSNSAIVLVADVTSSPAISLGFAVSVDPSSFSHGSFQVILDRVNRCCTIYRSITLGLPLNRVGNSFKLHLSISKLPRARQGGTTLSIRTPPC